MIIRPEAEADLAAAHAWYEAQRAGLGDDFVKQVGHVLAGIEHHPEIHAPGYRSFRHVRLRRFPYAVYYRIEDQTIVIHGVIHNKRDPRHWRSRG